MLPSKHDVLNSFQKVKVIISQTGIVTWEHNRPNMALAQLSNTEEQIVILEHESEPLVCPKFPEGKIYECREVMRSAERPILKGCKIYLNNSAQHESETIKVHATTFQRQKRSIGEFKSCQTTDSWNNETIRQKIMDWRDALLNFRSHQWYKKPCDTPLDPQNPKIKILLSPFVNRTGFHKSKFRINSIDGMLLLNGFMINGLISEEVPPQVAMLDDWKLPISIFIFKPTEVYLLVEEDLTPSFIVTGQLLLGQLDGLVVMEGVVTNSPEGQCSNVAFQGLGLVAQYKNGIPFGKVWKQLLGRSWIYGEVDQNGDLTGDKSDQTTNLLIFKLIFFNV